MKKSDIIRQVREFEVSCRSYQVGLSDDLYKVMEKHRDMLINKMLEINKDAEKWRTVLSWLQENLTNEQKKELLVVIDHYQERFLHTWRQKEKTRNE